MCRLDLSETWLLNEATYRQLYALTPQLRELVLPHPLTAPQVILTSCLIELCVVSPAFDDLQPV